MLIFVIANACLVLFCLTYLIVTFGASGLGWLGLAGALVAGYFLADLASGAVHWATDTWFSEEQFGRAIAIAREHHIYPHHILGYRFIEHATLGSAPSVVCLWPLAGVLAWLPVSVITSVLMVFLFVTSLCLLFGTSFHNIGHRRATSPIVRCAQKLRLVITLEHHMVHHRGDQTVRYCTVNGWANPLCDRLKVWRVLEWLIKRLTGAVPRQNDLAWQTHFERTGRVRPLSR